MENYQKLKEVIYKAKHNTDSIEEAMQKELKFGCRYSIPDIGMTGLITNAEDEENIKATADGYRDDSTVFHIGDEGLLILGRPITIANVLFALGDGYICETSQIREGKLYFKFDSPEPMFIWNLKHDNLDWHKENQPETVKFLIDLLVK